MDLILFILLYIHSGKLIKDLYKLISCFVIAVLRLRIKVSCSLTLIFKELFQKNYL